MIIKNERITFIPPRSYIDRAKFTIAQDYYREWKTGYTQEREARSDDAKIQTTISSKKFSISETPLDFRNFLTFSYKEDFSGEFFVDNEFYVSEVVSMDRRHFYIYKHDSDNNPYREEIAKYKNGTSFYLRTY